MSINEVVTETMPSSNAVVEEAPSIDKETRKFLMREVVDMYVSKVDAYKIGTERLPMKEDVLNEIRNFAGCSAADAAKIYHDVTAKKKYTKKLVKAGLQVAPGIIEPTSSLKTERKLYQNMAINYQQ